MADSTLANLTSASTPLAGTELAYIVQSGNSRKTTVQDIADLAASGAGDVVGPASATDNAIARYDGTTGKLIQNSGATISDAGAVTASDFVGAVMESDYTPAHSLLVQQSGTGSPTSLSVGNNTILGRLSGGGSAIDALTGTEATTLLDAFTSSLKGLAPASGGGTTNFLRADGTWAAPSGGSGDVSKVGTPVNNQVGVWTGDGTLEGDASFTFDTTTDRLSVTTSGIVETGTIELGNASDTTISRTGAGDIAVEGNAIYRAGGTDVPVADGGTGASTAADARVNLGVMNIVVLASDQTNNNAVANTMQDITGLSFAVTAGETYYFHFVLDVTTAATTTGYRFSVNGPAATRLSYRNVYPITTTTQTIIHGSTTYDNPAASNASSASTAGNIAVVEGFVTPSASGTLIGRFASEVAASAVTVKAGSILEWYRCL